MDEKDKKKNKKLKKALMKKKATKAKQKIKQKVKQSVKQSTNINIKIGDTGKKKKPKRKKKQPSGEPMRLQRRPHLPTNPLIGAITYTPPPGYSAPSDLARALPPPPPAYPPPPLPVAPAPVEGPAGELGAAVGAEGVPLVPFAPAGIAPLLPPRRREEIVPEYNYFEQPSPRSALSGTSYATSFGTSGGALSPRSAISRTRAAPAYNPTPSEALVNRLEASGFATRNPPDLARQGSATKAEAGSISSQSEQEDEGKSAGGGAGAASPIPRPTLSVGWASGTIQSVNSQVFRQGQALNGLRTGLAPINSGGASGGLIGGGSTMMGNQGAELEPQTNYPGQKVYAATYENTRGRFAGRAGQPKLPPSKGGAGGKRKGSGRKPRQREILPNIPSSPTSSTSSSSSFGRLRKAIGGLQILSRKPREDRVGARTKKSTNLGDYLVPSSEAM